MAPILALILALGALLILAAPAFAAGPLGAITDQLASSPADEETTDEGGLLGVVDDVIDPLVPDPADSADRESVIEETVEVVDEVLEPVTDVLPDVDVDVSAVIQTPLAIVPKIELDVAASTDLASTTIQVAATVDRVAEVATEIDLSTEVGGAGIEPPIAGGGQEDILLPEDDPIEASQPATAAMPDAPVRPVAARGAIASVGSSISTAPEIAPAADGASSATGASPAQQIGERAVGAVPALAEASSSFLASSGIGLTVIAVLGIVALIPPLLWGRLLPASAFWRPMHVVLPPDPPG